MPSLLSAERPVTDVPAAPSPEALAHFEKLLAANGDGRGFVVGEAPSFADMVLFLMFENIQDNGLGAAYARCPALAAHGERMAARPGPL